MRVISLEKRRAATKIIGMIKTIATKLDFDVKPELVIVKTVEDARKYRHIGGQCYIALFAVKGKQKKQLPRLILAMSRGGRLRI